ncbi:MAG: ABC transporter ATP-binding protein/permease [Alphaproteobacteria bacterium]|nr:ABC transporter ATP-binding protein/permease [Alphaproteobacteria bacterium]
MPAPPRRHRGIWMLLPYLWPKGEAGLRMRVIAAMVALAGSKVANVYVPLFYRDAVDALSDKAAAVIVLPIGLLVAYGGTRVLAVAFAELREALFARVAQRAMRQAALRTFRHLHALSLRYHLERQTGGLSRVIERGIKGIEFLLGFMLFNILPTLLEILLVCGVLWGLFNIWFAVVTFVTIVGYIVFTLLVTEWRIKYRREMNDRDTEANTKAIDSLLNYETVKYFGNEEHEARRFDRAMRAYENAAVRSIVSLSALNVGQGAIIAVGLVSVMAMAGNGVVAGTMTIGDFVLVNTYLIQLYLPLNFLGFVYRNIRQSLVDMDDMFKLLHVDQEVVDRPDAANLRVDRAEIRFENVSFGYDPRRPILHDVSFTVPPGKTVAIVGPSGAGKSTISRILYRFYDVTSGRVLIDGQDIRDVRQSSLRETIGIVPQDTVLFNDTVYYNIAYARPNATPSEVEDAAKLARIHAFIQSLPDGYQSIVGERGLKLSGGEKQRVAIARTILKHPRILLFDEATSALDSHTEQEIQRSLDEVSTDRTTLIIAHRLSTVIGADDILVLEQGQIVEQGTHRALLEKGGAYAALWQKQQRAAESEEADAADADMPVDAERP